jgi:hypothetical protein
VLARRAGPVIIGRTVAGVRAGTGVAGRTVAGVRAGTGVAGRMVAGVRAGTGVAGRALRKSQGKAQWWKVSSFSAKWKFLSPVVAAHHCLTDKSGGWPLANHMK